MQKGVTGEELTKVDHAQTGDLNQTSLGHLLLKKHLSENSKSIVLSATCNKSKQHNEAKMFYKII